MQRKEEEEDASSECSSGCQSGWTAYFDHSSSASLPHPLLCRKGASFDNEEEEEEEEEDLSMVSDASSGPPHLHEDSDEHSSCCLGLTRISTKKRRVEAEQQQRERSPLLDDTASSLLKVRFFLSSLQSQLNYPACSPPSLRSQPSFHSDKSSNGFTVDNVLEFSCGFSATHEQRNSEMKKQMSLLRSPAPVKQTPAIDSCCSRNS